MNVRLGRKVEVLGDQFSSCAFDWKVGQRVGAFLHRTRGRWTTSLCSLSTAGELERATRPYPRAVGRGRVALLAGGNFGDARLMALDPSGRILGYGFGQGAVRRISVCPGGRVAAELLDRGRRRTLVAVRSLESLRGGEHGGRAAPHHRAGLRRPGRGDPVRRWHRLRRPAGARPCRGPPGDRGHASRVW